MAVFRYEALNKQGAPITGTVTALSGDEAIDKLREAGITVTDIAQEKDKGVKKAGGKKVGLTDLSLFSRQMAAMISAGIPVTQAMQTLSTQTANKTLAQTVKEIAADVESGTNLSDAFSQHKDVFNDLYCSMIAAGEVGGMLEKTLDALSLQLHKDKQLKDAVKSATTYPKLVGGFALILLVVMLVVMVPIFQGMIPETVDLNPITAMIFALSNSIRSSWYIYILSIIAIFVALKFILKTPAVHMLWEKNKMRLPLVGELISKTILARFCRILSTLLNGGVTAVQALESAGPTSGSDMVKNAVTKAIADIENGRSIHESLDESGLFPPMLISMVSIGEEAGTLPQMLNKVAEFYEEDVATIAGNLGTILEPIMLVLIGVVVGGMLISLYLPIFQATTSTGA